MSPIDELLAPIPGAEHRDLNGVSLDIAKIGAGRVKRVIYAPGFRWSTHMKPKTGTDLCMHAHVGFIVRGKVGVRYSDGCVKEFTAPAAVEIASALPANTSTGPNFLGKCGTDILVRHRSMFF